MCSGPLSSVLCVRFCSLADAPAEGGAVQAETQPSALRDNLARKGKNSYYYAHTRYATLRFENSSMAQGRSRVKAYIRMLFDRL